MEETVVILSNGSKIYEREDGTCCVIKKVNGKTIGCDDFSGYEDARSFALEE